MKVNVVMLVRNRHKLTWQALDTLGRNTPSELFNLTLVDDYSMDSLGDEDPIEVSLRSVVRSIKSYTTLRIAPSKGITGMARNLGVWWSERYWGRGEFLLLTDNDVYFTPGWIEQLTYATAIFNPYKVLIVGGWNHPFLQPQEGKVGGTVWPFNGDKHAMKTHDAVAGASQMMRWWVWDKYGPLDANAPGVGQSEDWAMCQRIVKDGGKVGSIYPRVVLNCGLTNSLGEPSPGQDLMLAELLEAKKTYKDLYWE